MDPAFKIPSSARVHHRHFVTNALPILKADTRLLGVAAAGSWASDSMDEYSDIDLVLAVASDTFSDVMAVREVIASKLGNLVAAFTGEHVGEPRVLICLYAEPLLHVDLKFVDIEHIGATVDRPTVLWDRCDFGRLLDRAFVGYSKPDITWIEQRFWTWIHYGATKILRGEVFEAIDLITFIRSRVLGPLALDATGAIPAGVRRVETAAPDLARSLESTVPAYTTESCIRALVACAAMYRDLLPQSDAPPSGAQHAAMTYLDEVQNALASTQ